MRRVTTVELRSLVVDRGDTHVSLFMPTHRAGPERQQDPIRFRNLMRVAESRLTACGLGSAEAVEVLAPARALPLEDARFWEQQDEGLALFLTAGGVQCYSVPLRVEELAFVGERFLVRPLLPLIQGPAEVLVLCLGQNDVKLVRATRESSVEVEVDGMPTSLSEALPYDDPEKQLQFHTQTASGAGRRAAVFFGTGTGDGEEKDRVLRFFRQVDRALRDALRESDAPLVLAGVGHLLPIYRDVNSYRHLVDGGITEDPRSMSADDLRHRGWALVRPQLEKEHVEARQKYASLVGTGLTSDRLEDILRAALSGRVELLLVDVGRCCWGRFDAASGTYESHAEWEPGDDDLLDLAAVQCLLNGSSVLAVEAGAVPGGGSVAAVFRY